jgi:hypothetical protein
MNVVTNAEGTRFPIDRTAIDEITPKAKRMKQLYPASGKLEPVIILNWAGHGLIILSGLMSIIQATEKGSTNIYYYRYNKPTATLS